MDLLKKKIIKKNGNLKIKRKDEQIVIENTSSQKGYIVFANPIFTKRKSILLVNEVELLHGEECEFKLLTRKLAVIHRFGANVKSFVTEAEVPRLAFVGLTVQPNSKIILKKLSLSYQTTNEEMIKEHFKGNILLLCPGYPSMANKYQCAFIHTRVQEYKKLNWQVDVAVVNELFINKTEKYNFEGVPVLRTGYNEIRILLQTKHYDKILIHFFDEKYAQILDASDLSKTKVFLYSHGTDTLYRVWNKLNAKYFEPLSDIPKEVSDKFSEKDQLIKRYNEMSNVKFAFVSNWAKNLSERLIGIKYKNADIIPCYVDGETFKYEKKTPELRKKVLVLRKFDNLNTYSIDINVRVILELSKRECFKDMEFSLYGDGDFHEELVAPLRQFPNVHIYKKFLTHEEIKKIQKDHGIALFASRFDTQGVSALEAAIAGLVTITSKNIGTEEYLDSSIGSYCETENYKEYADLIEKLYYDENLFLNMSEKTHESVAEKCSYENTMGKDIYMIEKDKQVKFPIYQYQEQIEQPLLTIVVPSYNVARYLKAGIHTLIDHPLSNKLEILIVSDGSKDDTVKIGQELEKLTTINNKSIVKLIDKENGGHGSTINKGLELARGKYFRLMDGDDYFITSELVKFLELLKNEDSDIVLTNYIEDFAIDGYKHPVYNYHSMVPGVQYNLEDMSYSKYGFDAWGPLLSTSTYKTEVLKKANFKLDEHCFYVDMEYNFIGYVYAKTITYYPLNIYNYYLGRAGQSVSPESFKRNYKHHEKVTLRLIKEFYNNEDISDIKKDYLKNRIIFPLIATQYNIVIDYLTDKNGFLSFDKKLKKYPEFYNHKISATGRVKIHRKTHALFINTEKKLKSLKRIFNRLFRRG